MHPCIEIVCTYRHPDGLSAIPEDPNTLTRQSAATNDAPRGPPTSRPRYRCQFSRKLNYDVAHHKLYDLVITAVIEVCKRIDYILFDIIIFLHRRFYDILCGMLNFQTLEFSDILGNFCIL